MSSFFSARVRLDHRAIIAQPLGQRKQFEGEEMPISTERRHDGAVAVVTVDNRAKLNIVDRGLMAELVETMARLDGEAGLRAVVLTGAGERAFIGGADIRDMAPLTAETAEEYITLVHRACAAMRDCPVPVIARIRGWALGAGLEIAASCDLRVATADSRFGMPEVKVGIPSVVEAALIPGLIGWGRARELLYTGEPVDAETALRWGLVEKVVAPEALDGAVEAWLSALLAAGPRALRIQKALMREWEEQPVGEAIRSGIRAFVEAWRTDEPRRLMERFLTRTN
jgi:enoyl-CoA hydratase/carnithine racemase